MNIIAAVPVVLMMIVRLILVFEVTVNVVWVRRYARVGTGFKLTILAFLFQANINFMFCEIFSLILPTDLEA